MRKLIFPVAIFMALIFAVSCKKNTDTVVEEISVAKNVDIKLKEPVKAVFNKATAGATVTWTVSPYKKVWIEKLSSNAVNFRFGLSGTYTITAKSGSYTSTSTLSVTAARYGGSDSTGGSPVDSTGGVNPNDTTGGNPIDSMPCTSYTNVYLATNHQETLTASSYTDSNNVTHRSVAVNLTYTLPTSCYSYASTSVITDSSNAFHHNVYVNGKLKNCPNIVCTQAVTTGTDTEITTGLAVGLHTFYIYNGATLTNTLTIQVN